MKNKYALISGGIIIGLMGWIAIKYNSFIKSKQEEEKKQKEEEEKQKKSLFLFSLILIIHSNFPFFSKIFRVFWTIKPNYVRIMKRF